MVHHPDIALMDGHMTLAYACVLIAALLPYVWTMVAKAGGKKFDNRDPRQWLEKQENPRVRRADYIVFDRADLPYLNLVEKFNCFYCSYGNGVAAYTREIAARTEQYWCPIKHARRIRAAHDRYPKFFDYGDAEAFQQGLNRLRKQYDDTDPPAPPR